MVRGKKNFLPPHPLVMGFGVLFRLDESCIAEHRNDRKILQEVEDESGYDKTHLIEELPSEDDDVAEEDLELDSTKASIEAENSEEKDNLGVGLIEPGGNAEVFSDIVDFDELMDKALQVPSHLHLDKPRKKYGLDSYPNSVSTNITVADDENLDTTSGKGMQRQRPYMSKSERRKAKKGLPDIGDLDIGSKAKTEKDNPQDAMDDVESDKEESLGSTDCPAVGKIARGRKGKLKKIKEKYAEQDEEERKLRMALLAVSVLCEV